MNIKSKFKKIKFLYTPYKKLRYIKFKHSLKKRNKAIKEYGYDLLNEVCVSLKNSKIVFFCAYGTLLGFIRENGFIPYDLDIDMGVLETDDFTWNKLDNILKETGLKLKHQFKLDDGTITERTYYKGNATIDFFLHKKRGKEMVAYIYDQEENDENFFVRESVVPLADKIVFENKNNVVVPIMTNYNNYLTAVYGEDWRTPNPNFKHEEKILKNRYANIERFKK